MTVSLAPPTLPMLIQYTVLLLLNATRGSLAEIDLVQPTGGESHWLWIEDYTVSSLQFVSVEHSSKRVFDRAVLTIDGSRGQLNWTCGRCDHLSVDVTGSLRPEFQQLLHQHLN